MCLLLTIKVQSLLETHGLISYIIWEIFLETFSCQKIITIKPTLVLSLESLLWSLRLENFHFLGSLAGELQPMRPDPIEPSLESSVKNSSVIENFGNSPVVWAGYLSSAGARKRAGWGEFPGSDVGGIFKILRLQRKFHGFSGIWFMISIIKNWIKLNSTKFKLNSVKLKLI